ncbi:unnamed protein product [Kuraishia capsulata CBS 1993]|uniref:Uncharacterized protein n=1 Tax=Kuraishia capsulata CBS 1993 TaxID=1382522 RepID=W6MWT8_9ASCO|nr:uncharacterized protein KUCA_T00003824001 [Kuraishia capsulata CBS 1993]CDK27845.1 unnamed protein product [Kuraishia capsulata CBS 1993]
MYLPSIVSRDVHRLWNSPEEQDGQRQPSLSAYTADRPGVLAERHAQGLVLPDRPQYHRISLKFNPRLEYLDRLVVWGHDELIPLGVGKTMRAVQEEQDREEAPVEEPQAVGTMENFDADAESLLVVEDVVDLDDDIANDDNSVYLDYEEDTSSAAERRMDDGFMAGEEYDDATQASDSEDRGFEDDDGDVSCARLRRVHIGPSTGLGSTAHASTATATTVGSSTMTLAGAQSSASSSRLASEKAPEFADDYDYDMTFDE